MTRHIRTGPKTGARQEWRTPPELAHIIVPRHGLDLDAAALEGNTVCPRYLGPDHLDLSRRDALRVRWGAAAGGRRKAWVNPPFSLAREFGAAALESMQAVDESPPLETAIFLLPANLDTRWALELCNVGAHLGVFRGRLKFLPPLDAGPEVEEHRGAAFPMMLVGIERARVASPFKLPPTFCLLDSKTALPVTRGATMFWEGLAGHAMRAPIGGA